MIISNFNKFDKGFVLTKQSQTLIKWAVDTILLAIMGKSWCLFLDPNSKPAPCRIIEC